MTAAVEPAPAPAPAPALSRDPFAATLALAGLKALAELFKAAEDAAREQAPHVLPRKFSTPVLSPLNPDVELATVTMTNPKPVAEVVDPEAFDAWLLARPEYVEHHDVLIAPQREVIAALREHCPADVVARLVTVETQPAAWARDAARKLSAAKGEPVSPSGEMGEHAPPGIEIHTPPSTPRITLTAQAMQGVLDAWRAGTLDLPLALPTSG